MSYFDQIKIGIDKPDDFAELPSFDQMRAAIYKAQYDSVLIRQSMMQADVRGLSGEDRYTLLAYRALIAAESYAKLAFKYASMPNLSVNMGAAQ